MDITLMRIEPYIAKMITFATSEVFLKILIIKEIIGAKSKKKDKKN